MNEIAMELLVCISGVSSIERAGFEFAIKFYEENILPQKLTSFHEQKCKKCEKNNWKETPDIAGEVWDIVNPHIRPNFGTSKTEIYDKIRNRFPLPEPPLSKSESSRTEIQTSTRHEKRSPGLMDVNDMPDAENQGACR